jgi:hypothetical protein
MKSFREFINEEMMPFAQTEKGFVGVDNGPVRDNINLILANVTSSSYATPYHALEVIRKAVVPFHISLPATNFLDGDSGHEVFNINQFGEKVGMTNSGDVVTKDSSPYYLYFEYSMNNKGSFDIFSEIVNADELEEILADIEDEMEEGDEDYYDDEKDAEDSYDTYKAKNQMNEAWYHTEPLENGQHKIVAVVDKKNPYKHSPGDIISSGEHSSRQYASDGSAYGPVPVAAKPKAKPKKV